MTSLAKALLPSSRAASADGPKQAMPAARTASATPATSGASGPTTTRSTPSEAASATTPVGVGDPAGQRLAAGHRLDAGVARRGDHGVDRRVEREGTDEGVLAGPGPDDEYLHATNLVAGAGERHGVPASARQHPRRRSTNRSSRTSRPECPPGRPGTGAAPTAVRDRAALAAGLDW